MADALGWPCERQDAALAAALCDQEAALSRHARPCRPRPLRADRAALARPRPDHRPPTVHGGAVAQGAVRWADPRRAARQAVRHDGPLRSGGRGRRGAAAAAPERGADPAAADARQGIRHRGGGSAVAGDVSIPCPVPWWRFWWAGRPCRSRSTAGSPTGSAGSQPTLLVPAARRTSPPAGARRARSSRRCGQACRPAARLFEWTPGSADNPYLALLGLADGCIVTGDSVSMLAEVVRARKPLGILELPLGRFGAPRPGAAEPYAPAVPSRPQGSFAAHRGRGGRARLLDATRDFRSFHRMLLDPGSPCAPASLSAAHRRRAGRPPGWWRG